MMKKHPYEMWGCVVMVVVSLISGLLFSARFDEDKLSTTVQFGLLGLVTASITMLTVEIDSQKYAS
jgi:hypothetical protein